MSINISLPPGLGRRVRQRVESGLYGAASEVMREALRLLDRYEASRQAEQGLLDAWRHMAGEEPALPFFVCCTTRGR